MYIRLVLCRSMTSITDDLIAVAPAFSSSLHTGDEVMVDFSSAGYNTPLTQMKVVGVLDCDTNSETYEFIKAAKELGDKLPRIDSVVEYYKIHYTDDADMVE